MNNSKWKERWLVLFPGREICRPYGWASQPREPQIWTRRHAHILTYVQGFLTFPVAPTFNIGGRSTNRWNHFVSNLVVSVLLEWAELSFCVSSRRFILLLLMAVQRYLCHYLFDNSFSGEHLVCFVFFFYKKSCYSTLKCSQEYFLWE